MFVRLFRYRVLSERLNRYLAIQEQAVNIYKRHESVRTSYFRNAGDPCVWLEVHWYPDEAACRRITEEISSEPVIAELWQEFQRTLDPQFESSIEEYNSPSKT